MQMGDTELFTASETWQERPSHEPGSAAVHLHQTMHMVQPTANVTIFTTIFNLLCTWSIITFCTRKIDNDNFQATNQLELRSFVSGYSQTNAQFPLDTVSSILAVNLDHFLAALNTDAGRQELPSFWPLGELILADNDPRRGPVALADERRHLHSFTGVPGCRSCIFKSKQSTSSL